MRKHDIEEIVYSGQQYDEGFPSYNWTLNRVIEWFHDKLYQIPEEYRAKAVCEIASEGGYEGCHYGSIKISYWRKETDAELTARAERIRIERAQRKASLEAELQRLSESETDAP